MNLRQAFLEQAGHCAALGSPFMARLLTLLAEHWSSDTALAAKCATFEGDIGPKGHSLPLRICGGLHALVLLGMDRELAASYPPHDIDDDALLPAVLSAINSHDAFLCDWISEAPQTNEVRRASVLIATAHLLAARYALPMKVSELGASGGLNLMFDQFHLALGDGYGPQSSVVLSPEWRGSLPPNADVKIRERRGVDLNPLKSTDPQDALKLQAYLWPDQIDRLERTRAAIALNTAEVDKSDAVDWLSRRLQSPTAGELHLVYSTVAWQYFPAAKQQLGKELLEQAGARAKDTSPLAWLSYEADENTHGAALTLRLWPGDLTFDLGRADFHGRWVDWQAPEKLT